MFLLYLSSTIIIIIIIVFCLERENDYSYSYSYLEHLRHGEQLLWQEPQTEEQWPSYYHSGIIREESESPPPADR